MITKVSSRTCFEGRETYLATDFHNLNVSAFDAVNLRLPIEESQSKFIFSWGALTSMIPNPSPDISLPSGAGVLVPSEEGVSAMQPSPGPMQQSQLTFGSLLVPIPGATTPQAGEGYVTVVFVVRGLERGSFVYVDTQL